MAALGDKNVRRLDIAVNDSFGVGGIQRVGNLNGQSEQNTRVSTGFPGNAMLQRHGHPETPWR